MLRLSIILSRYAKLGGRAFGRLFKSSRKVTNRLDFPTPPKRGDFLKRQVAASVLPVFGTTIVGLVGTVVSILVIGVFIAALGRKK